jgi:pyridine nucleotide-disulfide oxidoreductase family protein
LTAARGSRRLLLLGGGHSHLFVLEGLAGRSLPGVETTLVSLDRRHAYSGMVPGMIGGRYDSAELSFDLSDICKKAGVRFFQAEATAIDPSNRRISLGGGEPLAYDVLSIAVGSTVQGGELPGVAEHARRVKPIGRALELVPALERVVESGRIPVAVVVGGGAAGVEVALGLRARLRLLGRMDGSVTLVESGNQLLGGRMLSAARLVHRALAANAIDVLLGTTVDRVRQDGIELGGRQLPADIVVWATGATATRLLQASGLATDPRGFVVVNDHLQSVSHAEVFAAGDAATLERFPDTPKAGVYAVREGPILWANLQAALRGGRLPRRYRPQRRFLALLNTGDGRAILSYGAVALWSRAWMALKDRIDLGFMRRFQRLQQDR